jgi:hypothetical protein
MKVLPKQKDKRHIPVKIYKGEELVKEADSIQEAARWLKDDTGDRVKRFTAITKGIWFHEPYIYNGDTYYFETHPEAVQNYFETINSKIIGELILHKQ